MAPLFAAGFRMLGQIARFEHDARLHGGDDPETRPMPELQPRPEALAGVAPEELITLVSGLPRGGRLQ
ncbi:MAG: hypothetical protein ORN51_13140 [Akkermansiaceae bacterium]|nr:hypothetical protein [Akkermansiaceae bacterium]